MNNFEDKNEKKNDEKPLTIVVTEDVPALEAPPTFSWISSFLPTYSPELKPSPVGAPPPLMSMESPAIIHVDGATTENPFLERNITPKGASRSVSAPKENLETDDITLGHSTGSLSLKTGMSGLDEKHVAEDATTEELLQTEKAEVKRQADLILRQQAQIEQLQRQLEQEQTRFRQDQARADTEYQEALREEQAREAARNLLEAQERQRIADIQAIEAAREARAREDYSKSCSTGAPTPELHNKILMESAKKSGF